MKDIVYNHDNLTDDDINRISRRVKAIIRNPKNEILLACSNENYHLPGGHIEENESIKECLIRELKEEVGVDVSFEEKDPILTITYYNKDYPSVGINSKTISKYYEVNALVEPDLSKVHLTEDEKKGNFRLMYVNENNILDFLNDSLKTCTRESVVLDTIEAIKEYLKDKEI